MILGLPKTTFFAMIFWPIMWLSLAFYYYRSFDKFEKAHGDVFGEEVDSDVDLGGDSK